MNKLNYIPILSVRPAEIVAMTEVPDFAKDRMLPLFSIRPWLGKGSITRATDRIMRAVGGREWIAHLDMKAEPNDQEALAEMEFLKNPDRGYRNWIDFVYNLEKAIPSIILTPDKHIFNKQAEIFSQMGRGLAIKLDYENLKKVSYFIDSLAQLNLNKIYIIIDYGQKDKTLSQSVGGAAEICKYIGKNLPDALLAVSATTFPFTFNSSEEQIYERQFHSEVARAIPSNTLIYSDHGSTRLSEDGGGSVPRPRIDLPSDHRWYFFRSDLVREKNMDAEEYAELKAIEYKKMADQAVKSRHWDPNLNIWGTQFIKITQINTKFGINSPTKATACRINIHLTRQALYGNSLSSSSFEEDWVD